MASNNKEDLGSARAPGATINDILRNDHVPPPPALLEQGYEFLGDADIQSSRYTSPDFFQQEVNSLWPHCWQWACRQEHIPDEGDNYVYDIGPYSVIVVRVDEQTIKAFINSCTHRGTRLLATEGVGYNQGFTCPFHGWSWHLNGDIDTIPGRWDFPHASNDTHGLREVSCEQWGGFVFINIDPNAKPLSHYLGPMQEHFKQFPLDQRRVRVHVQKKLPANWKVAQEAFMEAYHNFETHDSPHGANAQYDIFSDYVSRFIHNVGNYSPEALADYPGDKWRAPPLTEQQQLEGLGMGDKTVNAGETARQIAAQTLRETMGEAIGVDLATYSDSLMLDSIEYHLFPNMFFFPGIMIPMVYRFRPNGEDIDSSIFDVMVLEPIPEGQECPEPPEPIELDIEQSYTEAEDLGWLAPVYDEDTSNLHMQTLGFKTSAKGATLGNYQEVRIRRVHLTLDSFMAEHKK